jgi:hypothetical protein
MISLSNQVKMKGTNAYDGVAMIFLNDLLIIFVMGDLDKKNSKQKCLNIWFCWKSWANYYILVYTHRKELIGES